MDDAGRLREGTNKFLVRVLELPRQQPSKYIFFFDGKVNLSFAFTPRLARNLSRVILLL